MSARVTATGNLGDKPEVRYTPNGKAVTTLSIAATSTRLNKDTGRYEDNGDPLWIKVPFWGDEWTYLADILKKGDRVSVDGDLVLRSFQRNDGTNGSSLELRFPRFLGTVPRRPQSQAYPRNASQPHDYSTQYPDEPPF